MPKFFKTQDKPLREEALEALEPTLLLKDVDKLLKIVQISPIKSKNTFEKATIEAIKDIRNIILKTVLNLVNTDKKPVGKEIAGKLRLDTKLMIMPLE